MFESVLEQNIPRRRLGRGAILSITGHVLLVALALYVSSRPKTGGQEKLRAVTFFNPPPPPPPPPPPAGGGSKPKTKTEPKKVIKKPDTVVQTQKIEKVPERPPDPTPETPGEPGGQAAGVSSAGSRAEWSVASSAGWWVVSSAGREQQSGASVRRGHAKANAPLIRRSSRSRSKRSRCGSAVSRLRSAPSIWMGQSLTVTLRRACPIWIRSSCRL